MFKFLPLINHLVTIGLSFLLLLLKTTNIVRFLFGLYSLFL